MSVDCGDGGGGEAGDSLAKLVGVAGKSGLATIDGG